MKTKANFTLQLLTKVACEPHKRYIRLQDARVRGLSFRVMFTGAKSYVYYRRLPADNESSGKICEINIGKFEDITIEQARQRAEQFNIIVGHKKDPSLASEPELTYGKLFRRYLDDYGKLHTSTWQSSVYNHDRYFERFDKKPLTKIHREDVDLWLKDLAQRHGKHTANRNFNTLRAVIAWGIKRGHFAGDNPCSGAATFKTQSRERFIQPGQEYKRFVNALLNEPNQTIQDFFWILLFTGARRSNVLEMEWNQIDFELMTWRIPKTKNGDSQTLPLTVNAFEILRRIKQSGTAHARWVFPSDRAGRKTGLKGHLVSPKKAWARLLERAGIEDLRIHDLRRTAGSYMAIQGVSPTIIGKALGHRSPNATAIYARLNQDPIRHAMELAQEGLADARKLRTDKTLSG